MKYRIIIILIAIVVIVVRRRKDVEKWENSRERIQMQREPPVQSDNLS